MVPGYRITSPYVSIQTGEKVGVNSWHWAKSDPNNLMRFMRNGEPVWEDCVEGLQRGGFLDAHCFKFVEKGGKGKLFVFQSLQKF